METERLQIRVKPEVKEIFQSICQNKGLKSGDLFEKMLLSYSVDQENKAEEMKMQKIIFEYLYLLVKATNLPKDENQMSDLVLAESRFKKLIESKIENVNK